MMPWAGIVVDEHALELAEETVAVPDPGPETAGGAGLLGGPLQPIADVRVGACPFRGLPVRPALHAGLKALLRLSAASIPTAPAGS